LAPLEVRGEEDYVYLGETAALSHLAAQEPCDTLLLGRPLVSGAAAFAFQRKATSPAAPPGPRLAQLHCDFSTAVAKMKNDGTYEALYAKYFQGGCAKPKL
jgi:ABC-type amino acid transport substrate-binding protein